MEKQGEFIDTVDQIKSHWLDVKIERHRLSNGKEFDYTIIHAPSWSLIIPVTSSGKLLMVEQYRPAWRTSTYEFPAGRLVSQEEDFEDAAKRELMEETGYRANTWYNLGGGRPVTWTTQELQCFFATDLEYIGQDLDDEEDIEVIKIDPMEFWNMVDSGMIVHLASIFAYLMWERNRI